MAFVHGALLTEGRSTYDTVYADLRIPGTWRFCRWDSGVVVPLASAFGNFLCKWGLAATVRAQRALDSLALSWDSHSSLVGILILISFRIDCIRFPRT